MFRQISYYLKKTTWGVKILVRVFVLRHAKWDVEVVAMENVLVIVKAIAGAVPIVVEHASVPVLDHVVELVKLHVSVHALGGVRMDVVLVAVIICTLTKILYGTTKLFQAGSEKNSSYSRINTLL